MRLRRRTSAVRLCLTVVAVFLLRLRRQCLQSTQKEFASAISDGGIAAKIISGPIGKAEPYRTGQRQSLNTSMATVLARSWPPNCGIASSHRLNLWSNGNNGADRNRELLELASGIGIAQLK